MKKRLIPMYSILAIAIVLLAAFVPSCTQTPTTGTIIVKATLCGNAWPTQGTGAVNYTLTPTGGSPISGTAVPTTHSNMTPTSWTCAYVSGGPAGAFLNNPSASQTLVAGGTITFTFDFELNQDAAIKWLTWTKNGEPVLPQTSEVELVPCNIIDAHFLQWVAGCDGYNVTMDETSWLNITQIAGPQGGAMITVVDAWCAVNKTPDPREKVSQNCTIGGITVQKGVIHPLELGIPLSLDVETVWKLVKGVNYTKAINWLGISVQGDPSHECVLFELSLIPGAIYTFQVTGSAAVALVGDTDVNPGNNYAESPMPPLTLTVNLAGP